MSSIIRPLSSIACICLSVTGASCAEVQPNEVPRSAWQSPRVDPKQMGKIDSVLLAIQKEYQQYMRASAGTDAFRPSVTNIQIVEDRLVIDAVAEGDVERLGQDLVELGGEALVTAGDQVSCQFPINSLHQLAVLQSLRFARPSYVTTR